MNSEGMNRRQFVGAAALATAGLVGTKPDSAQPQQRPQAGKPGIKVGLYSITFLGVWYQGKALTLEQIIQKAKECGYDGIEIDGKRPHGNPNDWPTKRCKQLRSMADGEGIEIYAVAGNNDFSSPICEHREAQIVYMRELIRMASDFGAPAVRVFFAWPGVTKHPQIASYTVARNIWDHTHSLTTSGDDWSRCRDALAVGQRAQLLAAFRRPVIRISMGAFAVDLNAIVAVLFGLLNHLLQREPLALVPDAQERDAVEAHLDAGFASSGFRLRLGRARLGPD